MRKIISSLVFIFALVLIPNTTRAADTNAGFIPAPIWFSATDLKAGDSITIYSVIYNESAKNLSGAAGFYDGDTLLGTKTITVSAHSTREVSVAWKVTVGDHAIRARFENVKSGTGTGTPETVLYSETDPARFTIYPDLSSNPFASKTETTTPAPTKTETTTTPSGKVEEAKGAIKDTAGTAFSSIDSWRTNIADSLAESVKKATAELNKEGATTDPKSSTSTEKKSFVSTPFTYVKLFFMKIGSFIFSHGSVFYGLIVLIIILFVRYLIRAPR